MLSPIIRAAMAASLLVVWSVPASAQQALSSEEVQAEAEARATIDRYYRLFSEHRMDELPDGIFHIPWVVIGGGGVNADTSREEALARFEGSLANLLEQGWQRSEFTITNVCVLNANAAIVSGYNTRYHEEGSEMSVGGVSYLLGKDGDQWKIISYTGHPRERVVRCD